MEIAGITDAVLLIFNSIHPLPRLWPRGRFSCFITTDRSITQIRFSNLEDEEWDVRRIAVWNSLASGYGGLASSKNAA